MTGSSKRLRFSLPLIAAFLAGCGFFGGDSVLTSEDSLLRYVPADSPWVVAAVDPLPDEFWAIFEQQIASYSEMMQLTMRSAIDELRNAAGPNGQGPGFGGPDDVLEGLEALTELFSPEMLASAGISQSSTYVIYGFGLVPVFRITLSEGHDLDGVIDRLVALIESGSPGTVATANVAGQPYRYIAADEVQFVFAVLENEFVMSMVPASIGETGLQSVLGLELPSQSIAESGRLEDIADEYGFTSHLVAVFDVERTAEIFLSGPSATDALVFDMIGYEPQSVSAVCRNEILGAARIAPLMAGGYTELNDDVMAMNFVVELRDDIAEGLATIPTSVQGLGAATDALFTIGLSVDIPAARNFVIDRLDAMAADPYECDAFAGLQESLPLAQFYLDQPLPPIVDSIKGFSATMDFGDLDPASLGPMPTDIAVSMLVSTDDARGALAMAQALDPQIGALNLQASGEIVRLDLPPMLADPNVNPFGAAFFVATDTLIGLGLGDNGEARLGELLRAPGGDPSAFMSMSIDLSAYYGLLADTLEGMPDLGPGAPPLAFMSSFSELMRGMQDIYSRETMEILFTERGVEIPVRLEMIQ